MSRAHRRSRPRHPSRPRRSAGRRLPGAPGLLLATAGALALLAATACRPVDQPSSELQWDRWGVPHVYADEVEELGWGFGWAQARQHADAILRLYGEARGRGAEYWGERYLASDRMVHALGIPSAGAAGYAAQPEWFREYLDAFAAGVNAYARSHPDAIADPVRPVLPVAGADVVRHGHRVLFAFLAVTGNRPPPVGLDGLPTGAYAGSNAWAIGPSRSASGNALLLLNPHLAWEVEMMRFVEAHLVGPEIDVYGATLLGLPVIALGFNERLGWTHTVNTIDAVDVYRLEEADGGYRLDGTVHRFEADTVTLEVRLADGGSREETLVSRRSVHGPVLEGEDGALYAVRTPALRLHGALREWWAMGAARDLEEFEAAVRRLQIPMFNVVYADADGRILYLFNGTVPERGGGDFARWQEPLPGDSSGTLWRGIHGYEDLPRIVDPAPGFVQNSNSPPWLATHPSPLVRDSFPPYLAPGWLGWREQRGLSMLVADTSIAYDELLEMRYSNRMLLADRILDDLLPAARQAGGLAARAADVLDGWDRTADAGARGAVLFAQWASLTVRGRPGATSVFATPWSEEEPLSTPDGLADPEAAVEALEEAARRVEARFGSLDVAWGEANRLGADPGLPGNGAPGDPLGIFHVVGYDGGDGGPRRAAFGDSWVAAVEFRPDGPRARALLTSGNATEPGAPGPADQLDLLSRKEWRRVFFTPAEVSGNVTEMISIEGLRRETAAEGEGGG